MFLLCFRLGDCTKVNVGRQSKQCVFEDLALYSEVSFILFMVAGGEQDIRIHIDSSIMLSDSSIQYQRLYSEYYSFKGRDVRSLTPEVHSFVANTTGQFRFCLDNTRQSDGQIASSRGKVVEFDISIGEYTSHGNNREVSGGTTGKMLWELELSARSILIEQAESRRRRVLMEESTLLLEEQMMWMGIAQLAGVLIATAVQVLVIYHWFREEDSA